ncbi:MAG: hypothetical protein WAO71_13055 [Gallionella sp.]
MDTLLRSVVASWAKHTQRFLAAIVQLYTDSQPTLAFFAAHGEVIRLAKSTAAPHYSLHPP